MIWFIILTTVMNNGDVYTDVRPATTPEYNNEQSCNAAGKILVDQKQIEVGTSNGKTYYVCQVLSDDDIRAATGKSGSNS